MVEPSRVSVPLLNPNEPEARLSALHVREGQAVEAGAPICTLETTKSTLEIASERKGYVVGLAATEGALVRAGERLCWVADAPDWAPPEDEAQDRERLPHPEGLRITEPALALAQEAQIDLDSLPSGVLITEAMVRQELQRGGQETSLALQGPFAAQDVVVYGGGGHGKAVIELLRALGTHRVVGVIDDGLPPGQNVIDVPVMGDGSALAILVEHGLKAMVNAVGGVGDVTSRIRVFGRIQAAGLDCPPLAHPTSFVEPSARLEDGVQVFPHAYVGSEVSLGFGTIVNTGAIVSHDCAVGKYANIAPGAMLAGGVKVGDATLIGMGVTVNLNVRIGRGARLGNSSVIKQDVPEATIVRAGAVWPP